MNCEGYEMEAVACMAFTVCRLKKKTQNLLDQNVLA